jgi:hypothetical protein
MGGLRFKSAHTGGKIHGKWLTFHQKEVVIFIPLKHIPVFFCLPIEIILAGNVSPSKIRCIANIKSRLKALLK